MRLKVNSYEVMKRMLASLHDDFSQPWHAYPCLILPIGESGKPLGSIGGDGYCRVRKPFEKTILVHRAAFELWGGIIPPHHDCCHHCDNPPCFRPIHLFAGTRSENLVDCFSKGRRVIVKGEAHNKAKLTIGDVLEIRSMRTQGFTNAQIARHFDYSPSGVGRILSNELWRCV